MQKQLFQYMEKILSPFLCGYRTGAVPMDLSKAIDAINHELLLAKLKVYGFDKNTLQIMKNYLSNSWQRTKINSTFSFWSALLKGVPRCLIFFEMTYSLS